MTPTPEAVAAARELIDAHDALRASYDHEPETNAYGWPIDDAAWLKWRDEENKPAYRRWQTAMDEFQRITGHGSRHPANFRPAAEEVIRSAALSSGA